jgi:hypothetical protein
MEMGSGRLLAACFFDFTVNSNSPAKVLHELKRVIPPVAKTQDENG